MEAKKSTFTQRTPEEIRAWFNRAKARIAAREAEAMAIIIPRNHPQAIEVLAKFDEETAMFNAMKP